MFVVTPHEIPEQAARPVDSVAEIPECDAVDLFDREARPAGEPGLDELMGFAGNHDLYFMFSFCWGKWRLQQMTLAP